MKRKCDFHLRSMELCFSSVPNWVLNIKIIVSCPDITSVDDSFFCPDITSVADWVLSNQIIVCCPDITSVADWVLSNQIIVCHPDITSVADWVLNDKIISCTFL